MWPWLWYPIRFLALCFSHLKIRTRIEAPQRLPEGPLLIWSKHASSWDIPVLASQARRRGGRIPFFQMGSFVGYRVLGPLRPLFVRLGGFPVLRPKEVLRLRRKGFEKGRIRELMEKINGAAAETRRRVLAEGGVLVVFPEGTRDPDGVQPLRSELELQAALDHVASGHGPVRLVPVTLWMEPRRDRCRRRFHVRFHEPQELDGRPAAEWLPSLQADMERRFAELRREAESGETR